MKKLLMLFLAVLMLISAAWAVEVTDGTNRYDEVSAWAEEDVKTALSLGLTYCPMVQLAKEPIMRYEFAEDAAALVALAYGSDLKGYEGYRLLRFLKDGEGDGKYAYETLGILQGREDGDLDKFGTITRQEAAVMLARAYRLYCSDPLEVQEPLSYADSDAIASWAKDDVALITALGVMKGVEGNRFDPTGSYTVEQCFVTLVRLYRETCQGKTPDGTNPFPLTKREAAIGRTWVGGEILGYAENENVVAIAAGSGNNASMAPSKYYISVIDKDLNGKVYRNLIKCSINTYFGDSGASDNWIEEDSLSVSEDGSQVYYKSILQEDVRPYSPDTGHGDVVFPKGVYTVTIDVATGEQTYTREDLPGN